MFIHAEASQKGWLEDFHGDIYRGAPGLGAFVQRLDGSYTGTTADPSVLSAIEVLKPMLAFTFSAEAVSSFTAHTPVVQHEIFFSPDFSIAVVDSIDDILKEGFAVERGIHHCLCRRENFFFVWSSCASQLYEEASILQKWLDRSAVSYTHLTLPTKRIV